MFSTRLPRLYYRTLLIRGAALWLLSRIIAKGMFALAASFDRSFAELDSGSTLPAWVIVISAVLMVVDLRRRKELALLHNLGVETSVAVAIGTMPAVLFEILMFALWP